MAQNNSINVVGLDFEDIKQSLKNYMESQTNLKDFNFDGSVLNTLLDVLAYNTHYQAFYSNMVANEMFLDSALLRPSVVSHAKQIGYLPASTRSSKAIVDINLSTTAAADTFIARGTEFSGLDIEGNRYKFVNTDPIFAAAGATAFRSVQLSEGSLRAISYIYNRDTKLGSILMIPNEKADISTISVRVYASLTDTTGVADIWSEGTNYMGLTPTSKVYFIQEKEAGIYEIYFGDGVLGQQPTTGNVIVIEYLETNGANGNGVTKFTTSANGISSIVFSPDAVTGSTASYSYGGSDLETVSQIKFTAPKFYQTGNRAVTERDYESLTYMLYPNTSSVRVYGGENLNPPQYGKVFVAIKPKNGGVLTSSEKSDLQRIMKRNYSVATVTPEIVDAEYTDLVFDTQIVYDPTSLPVSSAVLQGFVTAYIYEYSSSVLEQFGTNFYYSKMVEGINGIHSSILGVYSTIKLRKSIDSLVLTKSKGHEFNFGNPISHPQDGYKPVVSSNFITHLDTSGASFSNCYLIDDGYGNLNVVRDDENSDGYLVVNPSVGVVEYNTGKVRLGYNFAPINTTDYSFPLIVTVDTEITNIYNSENGLLRINSFYVDSVVVTTSTEYGAEALASVK